LGGQVAAAGFIAAIADAVPGIAGLRS
jgi:hypothetical protein